MNGTTTIPDPEKRFQQLVRQLLMVESSVLQDTQQPFTQQRLHEVLDKFCAIIAAFIGAESCTVQLTMYDPGLTKVPETIPANSLKVALDERCEKTQSGVEREQREKNYQSVLAFPYWWSGKGVMRLVATNEKSVWRVALDPGDQHAFLHLTTGITTNIVQDKFPRVRNRWEIRGMRHWKKLGPADTTIWDNSAWTRIFRNYYGVPIQIHASGETVGLLKLENKHWEENNKHENYVERLFSQVVDQDCQPLLDDLMESFEEGDEDQSQTYEPVSFLARAYLLMEVQSLWNSKLFGRLFDKYEPPSNTAALPPNGRAPVQLFTLESHDEKRLYRLIMGTMHGQIKWAGGKINLRRKRKLAKALFLLSELDKSLSSRRATKRRRHARAYAAAIAEGLRRTLIGVLKKSVKVQVRPWPQIESRKAHFAYEISLYPTAGRSKRRDEGKREGITLISVVPPSSVELEELTKSWRRTSRVSAGFYERFIPQRGGILQSVASWKIERKDGEFAIIRGDRSKSDTAWVRDLWIDRMAARTQALVFAVPVPKFMPETDTRLLTWAAFEIGKLIERRIAYHANRGADPMPLTSVDFFQIPISSACFVDNLKDRRIDAERAENHLDHHIRNLVLASKLNDHHEFVRCQKRVKRYDSYLGRLGERWDGHVRGSLATYFLLLGRAFDHPKMARKPIEQEAMKFKKALTAFRVDLEKHLEDVNEPQRPVVAKALESFRKESLPHAMTKWAGDVDFLTPPLPDTFPMVEDGSRLTLNKALQILVKNLACGGIRGLPEDAGMARWLKNEHFLNLLFRNHDPFLSHSASLLCQILNRVADGNRKLRFSDFYCAAYHLKDVLSHSWREMEGENLEPLQVFWKEQTREGAETPWAQVLSYVAEHETKQFMKHFSPKEYAMDNADNTAAFLLPLTSTGIYKRIRMLTDVLHRQRSSAHLDWLTRRFDFLGFRLTCLYKNQVFSLYEQVWNQGDPFFLYNTDKSEWKSFCAPDAASGHTRSRTRWLCLRTNVHEDEYRALQVAALADPSAIEGGHWDRPGYNLRRLKRVLGTLFRTYEAEQAEKYRGYAYIRNRFRRDYLAWFRDADIKTRPDEERHLVEAPQAPGQGYPDFGKFLCEAVFDSVLARFDSDGAATGVWHDPNLASKVLIHQLSNRLEAFLGASCKYTMALLQEMESPKINFRPTPDLCMTASALYNEILQGWTLDSRERDYIEAERDCLLGTGGQHGEQCDTDWRFPAVWVPTYRYKSWAVVLNATDNFNVAGKQRLIRLWEEIRRDQKEFLFYRGTETAECPGMGLRWRDRDSVLHRIVNYVLLFSPETPPFNEQEFGGWTAYDLFYYVRSLVPVEIQIRTAFADTIAEQYHGAIYKGRPRSRKETEAPRKRLEELSRRLADLDNELEIDFENFADRIRTERAKEP